MGGEEPGERLRQERGAVRRDPGGHLQGRRPRRDSGREKHFKDLLHRHDICRYGVARMLLLMLSELARVLGWLNARKMHSRNLIILSNLMSLICGVGFDFAPERWRER